MRINQLMQSQADNSDSEIDLTPMLDVVFIMLIFFIVTASFIKEAGVDVTRPEAATAQQVENVNILIAITATNEIWIDKRRVDRRSVRSIVERMHAENPKGAVVIQADKKSNTETVTSVIDSSRAAGVYDVSLATSE
ncbi:biopolymer transporter ExbD [Endozoicomonas sp. OPT23]|uniref:ExbD/TolR family protein n=1 Tax=Endozoicomonas sp. OPT23 TaxID=2072845 RepID=UPI0018918FE1|nr:biopolymer transporter ExbD [Endozoicomonas sp. OPT23]